MSDSATAIAAATTNWRTYDGVVPQKFIPYVVFFPLLMATCIVLPTALCYCCLARGRPTPYSPPNAPGLGTTSPRGSPFPSSSSSSSSSSSPMWPSVSFSLSSPSTTKVVKSPVVETAAPAGASATTLVDSSVGVLEKSPLPQKSPGLTEFPDSLGSLASPRSLTSARSPKSAGFEESPILKSFSPSLPSSFGHAADRWFIIVQIGRVLTMDRSITGPWQRSEK